MRHEDGWEPNPDGLRLYWQCWKPAEPRAVLLFVHGLGEHSGRYAGPSGYFTARGFACYGLDLRGHGRSPGRRVHVTRFDEWEDDIRVLEGIAQSRHPDSPLVLVGHSQGGLLALRYVLRRAAAGNRRHSGPFAGLVLSSPLLGIHPTAQPGVFLKLLAQVLARLAPRFLIASTVDPARLSHDTSVVEAYRSDPLVSRKVSAGWYAALQGAMADALTEAPRLSLRTLALASPDDTLTDSDALRRFLQAAPQDLVEAVWLPGLYHELFNELTREDVYAGMDSWLQKTLSFQ